MSEPKTFKMVLKGRVHRDPVNSKSYKRGDVVMLTESQMKAFGSKFESYESWQARNPETVEDSPPSVTTDPAKPPAASNPPAASAAKPATPPVTKPASTAGN